MNDRQHSTLLQCVVQCHSNSGRSRIHVPVSHLNHHGLLAGDIVICYRSNGNDSRGSNDDVVQACICTVWPNDDDQLNERSVDVADVEIDRTLITCTIRQSDRGYQLVTTDIHINNLCMFAVGDRIVISPIGTTLSTCRNAGNVLEFNRISLRLRESTSVNSNTPSSYKQHTYSQLQAHLYRTALVVGSVIECHANHYYVYATSPDGCVGIVTHATNIVIDQDMVERRHVSSCSHDLTNTAMRALYNTLMLRLHHDTAFTQLGVQCPRGILLCGPPGVGKTYSLRKVSDMMQAHVLTVDRGTLHKSMEVQYSDNESALSQAFALAVSIAEQYRGGIIIFIDELDMLCPQKHSDSGSITSDHMTQQLIVCMDALASTNNRVAVVGATNYPNAVDRSLRRSSRFDREITLNVPDTAERLVILQSYTNKMQLGSDVDLPMIAERCIGYVGADLQALCRHAAITAMRQYRLYKDSHTSAAQRGTVGMNHLESALLHTSASSRRGLFTPSSDRFAVPFEAIGGLQEVKLKLTQAIEWPLLHNTTYKRLDIKAARGVLLYGPPGCAKTSLVRALAAQRTTAFFYCDSASVYSSYVGESERFISTLFARARANLPAIVFIDEIDSIVGKRGYHGSDSSGSMESRILSTLLSEMDGIQQSNGLIVAAATNRLHAIDEALLRPGRFDSLVYVPPPDESARLQILQIHSKQTPLADDVDLTAIAHMTERYSGADLQNVVREACMAALRDSVDQPNVTSKHFQLALQITQPSLTHQMLHQYEQPKTT